MTPDQFRRAEEVFHLVADLTPELREDRLRGEDDAVVEAVRRLLAEEDSWGDESAIGVSLEQLLETRFSAAEGDRIGPYRLRRLLGEGGMGVVYEAEQLEPVRRTVALKLIKWGMDTRVVLSRFRAERQAMAMMDHPSIAKVYGAGATEDGRPYFAMELVDGEPLTDFCDRRRATLEGRLELFTAVCDAVQHAHQRGLIHRDLKPSNILVREVDGRPQPAVIDFGIAKATAQDAVERSLQTVHGAVVGTPDYMSPEQADSGGIDVDTRSDVFSLGVVLHELLVGQRPHPDVGPGPSGWELHRRRLMEETPRRPSQLVSGADDELRSRIEERGFEPTSLARRLRHDLDWIIVKCLERDRERRFASAADLAGDLRRYLCHEPVAAGPPDRLYRLRKYVQRHRVAVAAAVAVAVALIAGATVATIGLVQARSAERQAVAALATADREAAASTELADFMVGLFEVSNPGQARGNSVTAREILDRGVERISSDLTGQPLLQGRLQATMGTVYSQLGLYAEALQLLEEALTLRRAELGDHHPQVAETLIALAGIQRRQMELVAAEANFVEALQIRQRFHGDASPEVGEVMRSLAVVHRLAGETDRARELLERALEITEAHYGSEHPETAAALNNLAVVDYQDGDYAQARTNLERSLAILEVELGPDHPDVGTLVNNLGMISRRQGDNRVARAYLERDLELSSRVLGPRHPDVAMVLRNLAFAERALGELPSARLRLEQSLSILEEAMGPDSLPVANALSSLADLAVREGRLDEAGRENARALEIIGRAESPQERRRRVRVLEAQARVARLKGEPEEASRMCRAAEAEAEALPDPAAEAARCRLQLALVALYQGDVVGAGRLYAQATEGLPVDRCTFLDDPADTASRAAYLANTEDRETAYLLLDLALAAGHVEAWTPMNPDLAPLANDPRWVELVAKLERRLAGDDDPHDRWP